MPETACLHIQARDSDPIRVVELPGSSVRIGRASYCEVRLSEPDLADEECRLKRRGGSWQLIPSRAAGFVWIDGRSVEATCTLPFDVPFRVGEHWLTLRPTGIATPDWRSYKAPVPSASAPSREEVRPPVAIPRGREEPSEAFDFTPPPPRPSVTPEYDHLSRWKGRQESRAKRSDVSPEERRWENRWRAAGERVRARPTVKATPMATPPLATPPVATPPVASPPVVSTPLVPPPPVTAAPGDESALRHASFGAVDLRERARRGAAPIDRRGTVAEVSPVVPPVPTLTTPRVESVPHTTAPYQVPGPPTIENRSGVASVFDRPVEPKLTTSESTPSLTFLFDPPAPSPAEPIAAPIRETPRPEECRVASDPLAPAPEVDEVNTDEASVAEDVVVPDDRIEAKVATEDEAHSPEATAPDSILQGEEVGDTAAAVEPEVPVAAVRDEKVDSELAEAPASVETLATEIDAEPTVEVEHATPPTTTALNEPIAADGGFVTDACPADSDQVILAKSHVDLTTSVHDACGQPRTKAATARRPLIEPDHTSGQPDPADVHTPVTETEWTPPLDPSARSLGSGSTAGDTIPPPSSRDWPTVRDILASHNASVKKATAPAPRPSARTARTQPELTELQEPAHWAVPVWLGWPPALIAVLVLGMAGCGLSWFWSVDARWSGTVAGFLGRGGASVKALPETVPVPGGSWWKSTPANLMLWSLYFDRRAAVEPQKAEQAGELLGAAAQASPVQAQVRFAMARRAAAGDEAPDVALTTSLGLSRDIEAQTWLGRRLLEAGKKEAALKVYRGALEMAARIDLSRASPPAFDDDTEVLRYHLPGEDVSARVIRDMADQALWTFSDWKDALPSFALIPLTAARLLRERGSSDADAALDLIVNRLDEPAPEGTLAPLHLAAQAEALALKSRWKEAQARYRDALEKMPLDLIKRSWWLNLAEIDRRLSDEPGRQTALGLARGTSSNDEVSQRAVDLMRFAGSRADKARAQR